MERLWNQGSSVHMRSLIQQQTGNIARKMTWIPANMAELQNNANTLQIQPWLNKKNTQNLLIEERA